MGVSGARHTFGTTRPLSELTQWVTEPAMAAIATANPHHFKQQNAPRLGQLCPWLWCKSQLPLMIALLELACRPPRNVAYERERTLIL